jgi:hypothetical protein
MTLDLAIARHSFDDPPTHIKRNRVMNVVLCGDKLYCKLRVAMLLQCCCVHVVCVGRFHCTHVVGQQARLFHGVGDQVLHVAALDTDLSQRRGQLRRESTWLIN